MSLGFPEDCQRNPTRSPHDSPRMPMEFPYDAFRMSLPFSEDSHGISMSSYKAPMQDFHTEDPHMIFRDSNVVFSLDLMQMIPIGFS